MLLIVQVVFALIAAFRGWGILPFGVLLSVFLIAIGFGMMGVTSFAFYLFIDIVATIGLGVMAFTSARDDNQ